MGQISDKNDTATQLASVLRNLKLHSSPEQRKLLVVYCDELVLWNNRTNLTGARDSAQFIRGPLFDALTLLTVLEPGGSMVDVGSGAGLPGIPAHILCPASRLTLVEPRAKRAAFLRHVVHELDLDARVEQVKDTELEAGKWTAAVAQAVWSPDEWIPRGSRLVAPGGTIYALASRAPEEELPEGVEMEQMIHLERPFDGAKRVACRLRRTG